MYKIIGTDQKEYGPVSPEDLRRWIIEGRADANTRVQREGETEWKPLSAFPEFSGDLKNVPPSAAPPKIVEPSVKDPEEYSAKILGKEITIDAVSYIKRSWELYKSQFSLIFPSTLVLFIAASACGGIPYFGAVIGIILNGVFYGGLYWFFLRVIRGEKAELMDVFAGFSRFFQQLMLGGAVTSLLSLCAMALAGLPFLFSFIPAIMSMMRHQDVNPDSIVAAFGVFGAISILFVIVIAFAIFGMWMFTLPLIIDKGLDFWPAMELSRKVFWKNWKSLSLLLLLSGLVGASGVILCIIGVFLTAPISIGAITYAYEDIFGSVTETP